MKKILLAAVFAAAFTAGAIAQTGSSIPPRDPPFGKGIPDNDTMHLPSSAGSEQSDSTESIPPRDPPFGKGDLRNEPTHLPSSASTQGKASEDPGKGEVQKSAKSKDARNKSALKKDNTKNGTKQPDSTPKSDTN